MSFSISSSLKPHSPTLVHHVYSPSASAIPPGYSVSSTTVSKGKLASLHPSYYHLVSSEILDKIPDLDRRRIYHGPHASLIFSCSKDDFLTDSGFPMPELDIEVGCGTDASHLTGLLSWDNGVVDASQITVVGPVTRSQTAPSSSQVSASASLTSSVPGL